jgi:hypothetical protein
MKTATAVTRSTVTRLKLRNRHGLFGSGERGKVGVLLGTRKLRTERRMEDLSGFLRPIRASPSSRVTGDSASHGHGCGRRTRGAFLDKEDHGGDYETKVTCGS